MYGSLCLQVSPQGSVWYVCDSDEPKDSELTYEDFTDSGVLQHSKSVSCLALPENDLLISQLYDLKSTFETEFSRTTFWVGSPAVSKGFVSDDLSRVCHILNRLCQSPVPCRTLGYWHELDESDQLQALFRHAWTQAGCAYDKSIEPFLTSHPFWPMACFLLAFDIPSLAELLVEIGDPRWFMHSQRPSRDSKLLSYLGVSPRHVRDLAVYGDEVDLTDPRLRRLRTLLSTWNVSVFDDSFPGLFVHRIFHRNGSGYLGLLKASRCFVRYLRLTWLSQVSSGDAFAFDPSRFFKHEVEREAFYRHLTAFNLPS